jgi:predicted NACHT family NTPase
MLCFMGSGNYAFVHRTFLEYFCAEAIVDRFQVEQTLTLDQLKTEIFGHWPDETWHEVLRLVAGQLAPKFVKEILEWLLEQAIKDGSNKSIKALFFAAELVNEVRNRSALEITEVRIYMRLKALTSYKEKTGEFSIAKRLWIVFHGHRAHQLLQNVWIVKLETWEWLINLARFDEDWSVREFAVDELARRWKGDPETLGILAERARSDEHKKVRHKAFRELVSGWKEDPNTVAVVKDCVQSDGYWDVRRRAVREIVSGWKEDPATLVWLKELAQFNENKDLRKSARQELARGWKENPEIQSFLLGLETSSPC